jgi:hypothetical protein
MYSRYFSISYLCNDLSSVQSSYYMVGGRGGGRGGGVSGGYNDSIVSLLGASPGHCLQDTTCGHMSGIQRKLKYPS